MKRNFRTTIFLLLAAIPVLVGCKDRQRRILIFTKTAGFHHSSIPAGVQAILQLGRENGFAVDTTSDAEMFREDSLKHYSAIVFLNTTGSLLDSYQQADFERYIQAGGGYVGVHAAADAEYDWGWYGRLTGGWFNGHPEQQDAVLQITDTADISTRHLPRLWRRRDEWYNFKKLDRDLHVLLTIDEGSYKGGTNGPVHPMAWFHEFDGGRAWYTALGHTEESYGDPAFLKHLLGGIEYAIGSNRRLDYGRAYTRRPPEEDRLVKTQLVKGAFFEPTEMTILPNLDILVTQRRGEIMLYKHDMKTIRQVGFLNAYWKTLHTPGVNAEEGVLGIQADPDFATNHFVYIYYSPADTSVNRLSRFTFSNDSIDNKTEKVVLEVASQREICCHTGGSIAFGQDHTLFVSTGDNSTPFDEPKTPYPSHGYAPLDDRPGHYQYDARRGAGNTNDLRGKILRIRIRPDGGYDIPSGNLFRPGQDSTRREIYVMGNRNPYRITVDQKNGFLYWGEVGPDAGQDSLDTRGPRGYDEINQARKAGFFGWPLFVGNNYAYHAHDYATDLNGSAFDPAKPINDSRNNTGLRELPPAQPALIWYPYGPSPDFPQLGAGGRCAMAGPVFYSDLYPEKTRMPDYFNGKVFIYDWIRGWFKAVTLLPNGDFDKLEPFMPHTQFNAPVDAEMGPDGKLYILEYGHGWFTKNADAGLARIDFNTGNVPPKIEHFTVDRTAGLLPFKVSLKAQARDLEKEPLTYVWDLGDGAKRETTVPSLDYTYTCPGEFAISVTVSDPEKDSTRSELLTVYSGNEQPEVKVLINGNKTFYFESRPVSYTVEVHDKADPAGVPDKNNLVVSAGYMEGSDKAAVSQGHQVMSAAVAGRNIMLSLDCKSCHQVGEKSVGPAFTEVAKRYANDPQMTNYLLNKIIKGGSGKWGETAMPAHPGAKEDDIRSIIAWIQTLAKDGQSPGAKGQQSPGSLPASGTVDPTLHQPAKDKGVLTISASYTNKGGNNIRPLTGNGAAFLRNSKIIFNHVGNVREGFNRDHIDLTGIAGVEMGIDWMKAPVSSFGFELRLDSANGPGIGAFKFAPGKVIGLQDGKPFSMRVKTKITPVKDGQMHHLYLVCTGKEGGLPEVSATSAFIRFVPE